MLANAQLHFAPFRSLLKHAIHLLTLLVVAFPLYCSVLLAVVSLAPRFHYDGIANFHLNRLRNECGMVAGFVAQ